MGSFLSFLFCKRLYKMAKLCYNIERKRYRKIKKKEKGRGRTEMNANETYYRKTAGAIGATMLFFLLFINLFELLYLFLDSCFPLMLPNNPVTCEVILKILYAAGYTASFMVPVAILKQRIKNAGYEYRPMNASLRVTPWIFLLIPACVTVTYAASYINAQMLGFVNFSGISSGILRESGDIGSEPYKMVLDFIVICVVPGFCEEFLFRGAILANCRPFGRTNAILISAILFAIMHQNPEQLFYTFVAGVMLGIVDEKTESIWNCTLIHIFVNLISTYEDWIGASAKDGLQSTVTVLLFELLLFVIGMISLVILIRHFFSAKPTAHEGIFGQPIKEADTYVQYPISSKQALRLFLTPTTVIFFVLSALQMLLLLFLAWVS